MSACCEVENPNRESRVLAVTGSDCCESITHPTAERNHGAVAVVCPLCRTKGKRVRTQTVQAMLDLSLAELGSADYHFCATERCPVVYFGGGGDVYTESQLRERVHQKHPDEADVFVCYCFRHTPGSIRRELALTGTSTAVEKVTAGVRSGHCACDIRNPQGSCCLGNVRDTIARIQSSLYQVIC